jgi:hypothetical protein
MADQTTQREEYEMKAPGPVDNIEFTTKRLRDPTEMWPDSKLIAPRPKKHPGDHISLGDTQHVERDPSHAALRVETPMIRM